jgi:hypothetical protein
MHQVLMWDIRRLLVSVHRDDDQRADRKLSHRSLTKSSGCSSVAK